MDIRWRRGSSLDTGGSRAVIRHRGIALVAAFAIAASTIAGAALPGTARADDSTTLKIGSTSEQNTSAPTQCCMDLVAMRLTYDGLAALGFDGTTSPEFAESWTTSPDGLTWTFKIRSGMQWSDGQPADANDAAFTLNYILKSLGTKDEVGNGGVSTYGWKDATGKSLVESVTAPDATTLVIKTFKPMPGLLWNNFLVLPQHIWKDVSYADANAKFQIEPPTVGTGPFILSEWKHGQYIRLTRNEHYWGQKPAVSDILIVFYKTADAMTQALQAGEIDFVYQAAINQFDTLAKDPNLETISAHTSWETQLEFNTLGKNGGTKGANTNATADQAFRDAIGYAIDSQAIVDKVYGGHAQPALGFVAPADANHADMSDIARKFDLTEAAKRLDAAGYKLGADGVRTDKAGKPLNLRMLVYPDPPELKNAGQFVVGWLQQLGITVTPVASDPGAFWDTLVTSRDWELAVNFTTSLSGFLAPSAVQTYFDPPACYDCWHPAEWKALYEQYAQTVDPAQAKPLLDRLDRMYYQALPWINLAYPDLVQAHRTDRFTNWTRTPAGTGPWASVDFFSAIFPLFTGLTPIGSATPAPSAEASAAPSAAASTEASAAPAPSAAPGGDKGSSGGSTPIIIIGVVVVVAIVGGLWLRRRQSAG